MGAFDIVKHFVADRLSRPEVTDFSEIDNDQGALMEVDGKKLAVYRDSDGKLHGMSAVCTHRRCIVDWNPHEHTWDCPCHGSRFDPLGHVKQGPAPKRLTHVDIGL